MPSRRAQAAPHFDRPVAVGERDALDREQRRARRARRGARALRGIGGDGAQLLLRFSIRTPNWVSNKLYIEPR